MMVIRYGFYSLYFDVVIAIVSCHGLRPLIILYFISWFLLSSKYTASSCSFGLGIHLRHCGRMKTCILHLGQALLQNESTVLYVSSNFPFIQKQVYVVIFSCCPATRNRSHFFSSKPFKVHIDGHPTQTLHADRAIGKEWTPCPPGDNHWCQPLQA